MTSDDPKNCILNFKGMCCNSHVMDQQEILNRTAEAYGTEATLGWERQTTHVNTQTSEDMMQHHYFRNDVGDGDSQQDQK